MFNLISWNSCVKFPRASFALNVFSTSNVVDFLYVRSLLSIWIRFGHRIFAFFRSDNSLRKASCCLHLYFYIVSTSFLSFFTRFFPRVFCPCCLLACRYASQILCLNLTQLIHVFGTRKKTLLNKLATEFFLVCPSVERGEGQRLLNYTKTFRIEFPIHSRTFQISMLWKRWKLSECCNTHNFFASVLFLPYLFFSFQNLRSALRGDENCTKISVDCFLFFRLYFFPFREKRYSNQKVHYTLTNRHTLKY